MAHIFPIAYAALLFGLMIPLAKGQTKVEKEQATTIQYSKQVRAQGADFEVVAETTWVRPAQVYGDGAASVGLRISNRSDKDFTFVLGDKLCVSLKTADGRELVSGPVPQQFLPKPIKVAAGKSETVTLPTHLFHTRIGAVCLGLDSVAGWNWLTPDVLPGKYRLSLSFENRQSGNDAWIGKIQTEALEIEVTAAK